jgi:predicted RNA methylase
MYERRIRGLSNGHWTPIAVATRAATLLAEAGATRILDVGSGVGKFCLVGAACTNATFVGVECRADLVQVAREAAEKLGETRASFIHADAADFSFEGFDGVYLYNPFFEHVSRGLRLIDKTVERSKATYGHLVSTTLAKLGALSAPGAIVTYSGFGGRVPPDAFRFVGEEAAGNDWLELWVKRVASTSA